MDPNDELIVTDEGFIAMVERFTSALYFQINTAGSLADLCSDDDQSAIHGLQMSYDRLVEAHMWAKRALIELKPSEAYQTL